MFGSCRFACATECLCLHWIVCLVLTVTQDVTFGADDFKSHPPQRRLPQPSRRPISAGEAAFVDALRGSDRNDGSSKQPWKSVAFAVTRVSPGQTLYLRGGTYYESVVCRVSGTTSAPITIRSYPGELAIIDAGLREYFDSPRTAWEPVPKGAPDEFRSTRRHPKLERAAGNFGDSMIPLNAYRESRDLRSRNEDSDREADGTNSGRWFGPGLWYDRTSERIHVRLAHTHIKAFGAGNYRGETDPRRLPLIVTGFERTPLQLERVSHVRIQDLVVRGGGDNTVLIRGCRNVELDNVTLYVANRGLRVETTIGLKVRSSVFRGPMPPWGSRTVSKYRAFDSHLFVPVGTYEIRRDLRKPLSPQCRDFEIAACEFTDGHDGAYVGGVIGLRFHHNLVDNLNDDGVYISAWGPPGKHLQIDQNRISRCLTAFAFGLGRDSASDPSDGVHICRNLIDLRGPVPYGHPGATDPPSITSHGRISGDHGGPIWDPMFVYHNTFFLRSRQMNGYPYGWGGHMRNTSRRVFNNIFVETDRLTTAAPPPTELDFQTDGNLIWSISHGAQFAGDFFKAFRTPKVLEATRQRYAAGWESHSRFTDPLFVHAPDRWPNQGDFRLQRGSAAVDAGVPIPPSWPDPLGSFDANQPDIGAFPLGVPPFKVGLEK